MRIQQPSPANDFLADHIELLRSSFRHWTGRELIAPDLEPAEAARQLYLAPFALLSHDTQADPVFNYANLCAQKLFEMDWSTFTQLPSRLSAEAPVRGERERLLETVARQGYIEDYQGIRISRGGRRFKIDQALIWNVIDHTGQFHGQAAKLVRWTFIDGGHTP